MIVLFFLSHSLLLSKRVVLNRNMVCLIHALSPSLSLSLSLGIFYFFSILFKCCMPFFYIFIYRRTGTLYVKVTNVKKYILKRVKQNNLSNSGKPNKFHQIGIHLTRKFYVTPKYFNKVYNQRKLSSICIRLLKEKRKRKK